nr:hypothetical protein [Planococcus glaciei]
MPFTSCVVLSGRLITGQNPASARGVALKVIEQCRELENREFEYRMEA